jgi:hypothetical protein
VFSGRIEVCDVDVVGRAAGIEAEDQRNASLDEPAVRCIVVQACEEAAECDFCSTTFPFSGKPRVDSGVDRALRAAGDR